MSQLVTDCPRCKATKITVDLLAAKFVRLEYDWQTWFEAFCVCRNCSRTTVFVLAQSDVSVGGRVDEASLVGITQTVNKYFSVEGFISIKDFSKVESPEHLPADILQAFDEGAQCLAVKCFNAAGTMFRLCVDHATRSLLPAVDENGLNKQMRRSLGLRLKWLFDNRLLPLEMRDLSACIKEDGNDGAHVGSLSQLDADDLVDFTSALLERLYTEPEKIRLASLRRTARRIQ